MRVLFIFPDLSETVTNYTGALNYGVASIAAVLKQQGHRVELFQIVGTPSEETFRQHVSSARPDLVGFSTTSHYARRLGEWSRWAHEASGAPVIVGGVHATLAPEHVSAIPTVHYTCVGEGEFAMAELCHALERGEDASRIPGLWVRQDDSIVRNGPRPIVRDLDSLPDPDLTLFGFDNLYAVRQGTFSYIMSRGCVFTCTYCCIPTLRGMFQTDGPYWRFLSPRRAIEQLRGLLDRYMPDARRITFVDAIFMPNLRWLREFAPLYKERIGLPFSCNMRADMVSEEAASLMADMGCENVRMGVESGDQRMTTEILKRRLKMDQIRQAFDRLREHGITRTSYNMVGLPTETLPLALKTVRMNAEIDPDLAMAFIFYPYPGTELAQMARDLGYLTDKEFDHYQVGVVTRMPEFEGSDILFVQRFFRALVRAYGLRRKLPDPVGRVWPDMLDAALQSPLFPRRAIIGAREAYRRTRHRFGEHLVHRSPRLYRLLGGRDRGSTVQASNGCRPQEICQ